MARIHKKQKAQLARIATFEQYPEVTYDQNHDPEQLILIPHPPFQSRNVKRCVASVIALRPGDDLHAFDKPCIDIVAEFDPIRNQDRVYFYDGRFAAPKVSELFMFMFKKPFGALAYELLAAEDAQRANLIQKTDEAFEKVTGPAGVLRMMRFFPSQDPANLDWMKQIPGEELSSREEMRIVKELYRIRDRHGLKVGHPSPWSGELRDLLLWVDFLVESYGDMSAMFDIIEAM